MRALSGRGKYDRVGEGILRRKDGISVIDSLKHVGAVKGHVGQRGFP